MSHKVSKSPNTQGPVTMKKSLAAGEKLSEATAAALGRTSDSKPVGTPSKNVK